MCTCMYMYMYMSISLVLFQPEGLQAISELFPFHRYFSNAPQPLFKGRSFQEDWDIAEVSANTSYYTCMYGYVYGMFHWINFMFLSAWYIHMLYNATYVHVCVNCWCTYVYTHMNMYMDRAASDIWARFSSSWRSSDHLSYCEVPETASTTCWWRRQRSLPWPAHTQPSRGKILLN